jgi:UDP-N-acetyl-D-glucosamine dehydrogenase
MPRYVVSRVAEALNSHRKALNGSRILLMGLAYKADVDDMRESPAFVLLDLLKQAGAEMAYYDPHIPVIRPTREHAGWTGLKSTAWTRENISAFDAAIISTAHRAVNYEQLAAWSPCIIDTRNAMANITKAGRKFWMA